MTGLVLLIGYAGMACFTARVFTTRAIRAWEQEFQIIGVNTSDRKFLAAYGIILGVVWPAYWLGRLLAGSLLASVPPSEKELRDQATAQKRRIADLERELGIGGAS